MKTFRSKRRLEEENKQLREQIDQERLGIYSQYPIERIEDIEGSKLIDPHFYRITFDEDGRVISRTRRD